MVEILVYIKHHLKPIWNVIEKINSIVFFVLYGKKLKSRLSILEQSELLGFNFRILRKEDISQLMSFFQRQPQESYLYFKPHDFDYKSLKERIDNKAFLMVGCFKGNQLVGYCFLRFFFNKRAFRGKIVDVSYQGQGIAKEMGRLTSLISKSMGFRLFATISKNNVKSIASSRAVNTIQIVEELPNDYLYVEYL